MTTKERQEITLQVERKHIYQLIKSLMDAFIEKRIEELSFHFDISDDQNERNEIHKKISILKKAEEQKFYQEIQQQAEKSLRSSLLNIGEWISLSLNNAEFFGFSGRLR